LIQVKGNTPKLESTIQTHAQQAALIDSDYQVEKNGGREEHRVVEIFDAPRESLNKDGWRGVQRIVRVCRWSDRKDADKKHKNRRRKKPPKQTKPKGVHYYILSRPFNTAQTVGQAVRKHWGIENYLHWQKDVYLKEDHMTISAPKPAAFIAFLNSIALNQVRLAGHKPSKYFFINLTNNINELIRIIRT